MANIRIIDIDGIGFVDAGVTDADSLLARTATRRQRKALAEITGLAEAEILKLATRVGLYRIQGIGYKYPDLLESVGVDTVAELAASNAKALREALLAAGSSRTLVRRIPAEARIAAWIEQARMSLRRIRH